MYLGSEFVVIRTTTMGAYMYVGVLPGLFQESVAVVSVTSVTDGSSGTCGSPTGRVVSVTMTTSLLRSKLSSSTSTLMTLIVILKNREKGGREEGGGNLIFPSPSQLWLQHNYIRNICMLFSSNSKGYT